LQQGIKALGLSASQEVDGQVARDGKEPGFKSPGPPVLVALFEYPDPGFLEKILSFLAAAREHEQVAEQAVLILLD
jgi:hypothetical protein